MASIAASVSAVSESTSEDEVSLVRLYALRATYLLLVIGLGATIIPEILSHALTSRGVIPSLLGAVWVLAFLGLRYPLQMLPLLMFELAWKSIWMIAYGLPQWSAGQFPPDLCRGLPGDRRRRHPDAARDPVGLCLAALREKAGCTLALMTSWSSARHPPISYVRLPTGLRPTSAV